jgi:phenylalanyl-tRNA synthetase beta chain
MRSVDQELIKEVIVFDLYTGENIGVDKKSVAFRVVLAPKETLTEDKIQGVMKKIIDRVTDEFALTLRK